MTTKIEIYVYLLLIFLLPTQFGKHFWPSFSFVDGLRIDYLSPTLFTTDILILILFLLFYRSHPLRFPFTIFLTTKNMLLILFSLLLSLGIVFSKSPLAGVFGVLKLVEMVFFGWYSAQTLGKNISYKAVGMSFAAATLFESFLAIAQFLLKSSFGGVFYFFGERTFTMVTPGIANASIAGTLILRSYGTLPHPNVLAAFLLLGILYLVGVFSHLAKIWKWGVSGVFIIASMALATTLSRTVLVLFVFLLLYITALFLRKQFSQKMLLISTGVFVFLTILVFYTPVVGRFTSSSYLEESFTIRETLTSNALWMIRSRFLLGVGLMNFLQNLPASSSSFYAYYSLLQPVHNIYLLVFAQLGIIAGGLFVYFLYQVGLRLVYAYPSFLQHTAILMFGSILFLGLFDHYFLTVQQGQLLFAFVIGLSFSLPKKIFVPSTFKQQKKSYNKSL